MSRYIDADDLIKTLEEKLKEGIFQSYVLSACRGAINKQPTADVVEVVHGEWVKPSEFSDPICNQCRQAPKTLFGVLPNYCPNCGAEMRNGDKLSLVGKKVE